MTTKQPTAADRVKANVKKIRELMKEMAKEVDEIQKVQHVDWGDVGTLAHFREYLNNALGHEDSDPSNC